MLGNLRIEFKGFNPPAENIAKVIWNILREKLSSNFGLEIILAETDKNKAINNGKLNISIGYDNCKMKRKLNMPSIIAFLTLFLFITS